MQTAAIIDQRQAAAFSFTLKKQPQKSLLKHANIALQHFVSR
jgi:hypothetical protein